MLCREKELKTLEVIKSNLAPMIYVYVCLRIFFLHFVANSRNTWQHKTTEDLAAAEKEFEDLQPYELPKAEMVDLVQ